jgi:hypothetical protein
MAGEFKTWIKDAFGKAKVPDGPTAEQLYGGPQAFSSYQPNAARAQGDAASMDAVRRTLGGWDQTYQQNRDPNAFSTAQMAPFQAALRQQQQASSGARQAATQAAAARGSATGGAGLQAGLAGVSGDANAAANAAANLAGDIYSQRQNAAMQSLGAQGQLGMQLNDTAFAQDQSTKAAQDAFDQWASEQQAASRQQGYQNAYNAAEARRSLFQRLGSTAANFANSWISRSGNSGGDS